MECYTILGSEGRAEPTGKQQGRIGEDDKGEREKETERERVVEGKGDGVDEGERGRRRQ